MIDFDIIATGSTGNAVIIEKNILVDAGVPYKKIEPFMKDLKLVLLTHAHSDHFKASTLRRMSLEKPMLRFGCGAFLAEKLTKAGVPKQQIDILAPNMLYGYGICNVIPVELAHDCPNYGYKIHFPQGKVFYATDTGSLSMVSARNYALYLVEANYKADELRERMDEKLSNGQYAYEQRAMKYHLSEEKANDWLYKNMGRDSEYVYLHCHVDRGEVIEDR